MFWLVLVVTLVNALALAYTVTNFGTLFRLRGMIFTGLALIPLALLSMPRPEQPEAASVPRNAGVLAG